MKKRGGKREESVRDMRGGFIIELNKERNKTRTMQCGFVLKLAFIGQCFALVPQSSSCVFCFAVLVKVLFSSSFSLPHALLPSPLNIITI
ncbi:hypothetical protein VNO78_23496 [Psophocarpus tetragonolobus]|uniref:Uncharacterized protein n=1 Tax=Psophocarpus tetragonolobus TaxID=3891 RepID=A0AAN9S3M8_PSOTE